jgi:nucleoside-specific outer membrane channel protein Tsx
MHNLKKQFLISTFLFTSLSSQACLSFDWTSTNLQQLYGRDFEFGESERFTTTIEHANGWDYGQNFFFVDIAARDDVGMEVYAELYTYLSFNKISGSQLSLGPIKDISLLAGLNISNEPEDDHFSAYLLGLSFDLSNEYFDYLQLDIAAYKSDDVSNKYGLQITPVWSVPFELGSLKFKFRGFTDFRTGNTTNSANFHILAQPQMLLDVGDLAGIKTNTIYIGTEYSYWHNKFGVKGVDESVVQAMIIGFF